MTKKFKVGDLIKPAPTDSISWDPKYLDDTAVVVGICEELNKNHHNRFYINVYWQQNRTFSRSCPDYWYEIVKDE